MNKWSRIKYHPNLPLGADGLARCNESYLTKITKPLEITVNMRFPFSSTETPLAHFGLSIKLTVLPVKSIPLVSAYFPTFGATPTDADTFTSTVPGSELVPLDPSASTGAAILSVKLNASVAPLLIMVVLKPSVVVPDAGTSSVAPELIVNVWSPADVVLQPGVIASVAPSFTVNARSVYESEVKTTLPQPVTATPFQ